MDINLGILLVLGIAISGGIAGALLFQRLHVPQVIGYIVIGVIIGESGLRLVTQEDIVRLSSLNLFALGIIGFLVGAELHLDMLKKYSRQFAAILIGEGLTPFLLVGTITSIFLYFMSHNLSASLAAGVVFGAIASATDPASTMEVLWEYRCKGILTTTIVAIVALDDALAMTLYGIGTSIAQILTGHSAHVDTLIAKTLVELLGAVVAGVLGGWIMVFILRRSRQKERTLAMAIGMLLLLIGAAKLLAMDVILATMTLGITIVNMEHKRCEQLIELVRSFSIPIYILFFVFVGARLGISQMPGWVWLLVGLYVAGLTTGKIVGAFIGAKLSHADPSVSRYTGMSLLTQGGVAIGLSIMASTHLSDVVMINGMALGDLVISSITAAILIMQLVGPPLVKIALKAAGETGKNITEEDIMEELSIGDVMDTDIIRINQGMSIRQLFDIFSQNRLSFFPVVDKEEQLAGVVTLSEVKEVMTSSDAWDWLVVADVMSPVVEKVQAATKLAEGMSLMQQLNVNQLPVVDDGHIRGIIDQTTARKRIHEEIIRRSSTLNDGGPEPSLSLV